MKSFSSGLRTASWCRRHWRSSPHYTVIHAQSRRVPAPALFHTISPLLAIKPVLLADIGEGIVECEVTQWFVEPGARVEEFSPLCEVQSDKASVEITSRFAGVVKKLYHEAGDMAKVGKPFVDIELEDEEQVAKTIMPTQAIVEAESPSVHPPESSPSTKPPPKGKHAALATPAVRYLSKELNVDISRITGSGRDGRVMKGDIYKFVQARDTPAPCPTSETTAAEAATAAATTTTTALPPTDAQQETIQPLTGTRLQMFKTMTRSLAIPHFLYADEIDFSRLCALRARLNSVLADAPAQGVAKLSFMPFIIKAVSIALYQFPILNARVDASEGAKPSIVLRSQHNVGVAMDTPSGLVVPVIRNVGGRTILGIAAELVRLQQAAAAGRLEPGDFAGGTVTVSNIGNIGGTYVSPVIVEREVAILGIGRICERPAFEGERVVRRQVCNFSWSADHRVVDGATMARAGEVVRKVVEEPDEMLLHLR